MGFEPMNLTLTKGALYQLSYGGTKLLSSLLLLGLCGPGRTRTCEGFRQEIYSLPPLPLGTPTHVYMIC